MKTKTTLATSFLLGAASVHSFRATSTARSLGQKVSEVSKMEASALRVSNTGFRFLRSPIQSWGLNAIKPNSQTDEPTFSDNNEQNSETTEEKQTSRLFGFDEFGNKKQSESKIGIDGNEIALSIDDELSECYPSCLLDDMKFSIDHDDFSGKRSLKLSKKISSGKPGFYAMLMRDTVYAEWLNTDNALETLPSLHIKMHLTENPEGPGPLWERWLKQSRLPQPVIDELMHIGGELRSGIFHAHEQAAIELVFEVIKDLLLEHPELGEAPLVIRYMSDIEALNETEPSGTVGEWVKKLNLDKNKINAETVNNFV